MHFFGVGGATNVAVLHDNTSTMLNKNKTGTVS